MFLRVCGNWSDEIWEVSKFGRFQKLGGFIVSFFFKFNAEIQKACKDTKNF